jgi:hypothetical protein
VLGRNSDVWEVFIGRALLVSADVSQPIQKIIGIGCITSADTINDIFVSAELRQPIPIMYRV